jgi:hypothetical protein
MQITLGRLTRTDRVAIPLSALPGLAAVVTPFGHPVRPEIEMFGVPGAAEPVEALATLRHERFEMERLLIADPRSRHGLCEINSVCL